VELAGCRATSFVFSGIEPKLAISARQAGGRDVTVNLPSKSLNEDRARTAPAAKRRMSGPLHKSWQPHQGIWNAAGESLCSAGQDLEEGHTVGAGLDGTTRAHRNKPMRFCNPHDPLRLLISSRAPSIASVRGRRTRALPAAAFFVVFWTASLQNLTATETDLFQEAVNYVFTGTTDPQDAPEIVDRKSCIVLIHDAKYNRYIRYHLNRFKMDTANFSKIYAGSRALYDLEVAGDEVILEYLDVDKKTVEQAYKSAQIPLPGNFDQTQKALKIIFADYCKADQLKTPF
jgi:hypothetical protein